MAKNMRNGSLLLLLLCNIAVFISQFHFGYATKHSSSKNVSCIASERRALLEFKDSLVDPANRLASWASTGDDCCSWDGITCNPRTGHVQKLDLRNPIQPYADRYDNHHNNYASYFNNCLGGQINPSLLNLQYLNYLDLSSNNFSGIQIPTFIGSLKYLRYLNLSTAGFSGELSESHLAKLKYLKYFSIANNFFLSFNVSSQWVPPFQLQKIYMDSVVLGSRQFPPWLQTQTEVQQLSMKNASISGVIPMWLTSLSSINYLDLSNNFLTGVLSLYTNCLANISLQSLHLNDNQLAGNIPDNFCKLRSLSILSLANNQLTGKIPLCFGNLTGLQVLDLANNSLFGHIPITLGNLKNLSILRLDRNNFSGVLPSSLMSLKFLEHLDLGGNQLTGSIPDWIGKELLGLEFLRLESNHFDGNISLHLCQLSSLQILNLAQNNLVGQIPYCFGNLTMMQSNKANGHEIFIGYTETLWNIIKGIELEYNTHILQYAKFISLSSNNLQGEIPNELLELDGLQSLNLSNNQLSGRIPENIDNLQYLESLDLAMNQLSGPIPQSLANIDSLNYLNLSFNNLVGRIPSTAHFDTLSIDRMVYEGNYGLCGKVIAKSCPNDTPSNGKGLDVHRKIDDEFEVSWFYAGIAPGFAVGLVGFLCILYFKKMVPWLL